MYLEFVEQVKGFASRYLDTTSDLDEVVQEVFVKLWEKRETIDPERSIGNFLFTIAKNIIFNKYQKRVNERAYINYLNIYLTAENLDTENRVLFDECRSMLEAAVEKLPEKRRQVYIMLREEGRSHSEIAEKLNISKKTIETHIRLALKQLKSEMKAYL